MYLVLGVKFCPQLPFGLMQHVSAYVAHILMSTVFFIATVFSEIKMEGSVTLMV